MVAFKNDPALKQKCLDLIKEFGFLKGINNDYLPLWHDQDRPPFYETELGLPEWLFISELTMVHLPGNFFKSWEFDYLSAIPVGADLSRVLLALNHWLLTDPTYGEWQYFTESNRELGRKIIYLYSKELYSSVQPGEYDDEWRQLAQQTANTHGFIHPRFLPEGYAKAYADKYKFNSWVAMPLNSIRNSVYSRYDYKEERELMVKATLALREHILNLLANSPSI